MGSHKPVFFDEKRARWRRTRRVGEIASALLTLLLIVFLVNVSRRPDLPVLMLPDTRPTLHAVKAHAARGDGQDARGPAQPRAAAPGRERPRRPAARGVLRELGPRELRGAAPAPRRDRPARAGEPARDLAGRPRPGRGRPEARRVAEGDGDRPRGDAARQQQRRHALVRRGDGGDAGAARGALRGGGAARGARRRRGAAGPGGRLRGGARPSGGASSPSSCASWRRGSTARGRCS